MRVNAWRAFSGTSLTATAVPVPGTPSIDSITPGDGTLEVAFSPGSVTDQVDTYTLTCVDQSSSRLASNFSEATVSNPHYLDDQPLMGGDISSVQAFHSSRAFEEGATGRNPRHDMFPSTRLFGGRRYRRLH